MTYRCQPPSEKVGSDPHFDGIVLRALEREPERRYQHASDVKTDVEAPARRTTILAPGARAGGIEAARHQVRGPANGLMVTAIVNWIGVFGTALLVGGFVVGEMNHAPPLGRPRRATPRCSSES